MQYASYSGFGSGLLVSFLFDDGPGHKKKKKGFHVGTGSRSRYGFKKMDLGADPPWLRPRSNPFASLDLPVWEILGPSPSKVPCSEKPNWNCIY